MVDKTPPLLDNSHLHNKRGLYEMKYGDKYNWKNQPERLIYIGAEVSNGLWYQFARTDKPNVVWCEVREHDLQMLEETKDETI